MEGLTRAECHQWRRDHSRRREWKRQFTCITPLNDLPWFAQQVVKSAGHLIEDPDELSVALAAALENTVDVTVLFEPSRIAVFADHDEYTTVFSSAPLGALRDQLTQRGVEFVEYHRAPP